MFECFKDGWAFKVILFLFYGIEILVTKMRENVGFIVVCLDKEQGVNCAG